jgi:hypothetical protein
MRFLGMIKVHEGAGDPPEELMTAMGEFIQEARRAGVLVDTGGLGATAEGTQVRLTNDEIQVLDGPFTEAREVVGGYAIYDVPSREEAVEWTRRFVELHRVYWPGFDMACEVRQIFGPDGPA